ncbi:MAG: glycine--tRNA ligase subunit beta [Robiginitomaculum sp.]
MAKLLFEILCEEIPARMQEKAGADLARLLGAALDKAGLKVDDVTVLTGPRRLTFAADIPARSPDISEERKGPRTSAPEQALAGFMRGAGISDISQAETRTDKKGEYYVAMIEKSGRDSADIIAETIPAIMGSFPWPKSMKSGVSDFRWVRPLTSLLCLLDGKTVSFEVGGIASGNQTRGHRRMGAGPFTVTGLADYRKQLEGAGHVMLGADDRMALILKDGRALCAAQDLELVEDAGLLSEVSGLVEWPVVILGDMDASFLKLPGEVIRLSMRTHQKYFAVRDLKTGALAPKFIVVANQLAPDGGKEIARGNSRVLSARLDDARFFQAEDVRGGKKLIDNYDKLDTVVFHKKLGSVKDKAERVAILARQLAPIVGADADAAEQAAKLAKCDLVTNMVVEFTSLQGQIGRLMYEVEGGNKDIAIAIEDHYRPQGPADRVPTNPVAIAVALADKLDTLTGFWAIDEKPTGSKDPFALRRAALGVVRILTENKVRFSLGDWVKDKNLIAFILDRLKGLLRDEGISHDIVDAVYALGGDDLVDISSRARALQGFLSTDEGANLLAGYKRASNILRAEAKKGALPTGDIDLTLTKKSDASEQKLAEVLTDVAPKIEAAIASESYSKAMTALSSLRGPIDDFFEAVMVNDDDPKVRENRLRLLGLIRDTAGQIANFDKIDG